MFWVFKVFFMKNIHKQYFCLCSLTSPQWRISVAASQKTSYPCRYLTTSCQRPVALPLSPSPHLLLTSTTMRTSLQNSVTPQKHTMRVYTLSQNWFLYQTIYMYCTTSGLTHGLFLFLCPKQGKCRLSRKIWMGNCTLMKCICSVWINCMTSSSLNPSSWESFWSRDASQVDQLYLIVFIRLSVCLSDFYWFYLFSLSGVVYHPWRKEDTGNQTREIMYTISLSNPLAPKTATVTETQVSSPEETDKLHTVHETCLM